MVLTLWQDAESVAALMRSNTYARTVSEIIAKRSLPGDQCVETFKVHLLSDLPTSGAIIEYGPDGPRTGPQRPRATKDRPSWLLGISCFRRRLPRRFRRQRAPVRGNRIAMSAVLSTRTDCCASYEADISVQPSLLASRGVLMPTLAQTARITGRTCELCIRLDDLPRRPGKSRTPCSSYA